jgi:transcriptional regulator with PAS, ATPase and Fis domain
VIESELFGHKKGSFTGAISDKTGLIREADEGTLFLDEVGELPLSVQVKLLRFVQDRQFTPVGEVKAQSADVRIISATNRDLQKAITEGIFREDLYYRLHVIQITIPPLRERRKDIPLLTQYFLQKFNNKLKKKIKSVSSAAMDLLEQYDWPGNVRELENTLERAVVMDSDNFIDEEDLMLALDNRSVSGIEAGLKLEQLSKQLLKKTLTAVEGNKTQAAEMMGVSIRWVHYKAKEWNLK